MEESEELRFNCLLAARDSVTVNTSADKILKIATKYELYIRTKKESKPSKRIGFKEKEDENTE